MIQRSHYFTYRRHYYRLALCIIVMCYLLPVEKALTPQQIGYGAVSVLLSWINLMQFLKLVPVLGIYIILVQKVFWTVVKVRTISVFIVEICHYTRKYMHAATPRLC
jgi:hypothetical protein